MDGYFFHFYKSKTIISWVKIVSIKVERKIKSKKKNYAKGVCLFVYLEKRRREKEWGRVNVEKCVCEREGVKEKERKVW